MSPETEYVKRSGPDSWADYASEIKGTIDILWKQREQGLISTYDSARSQPMVKKPAISRTWLLLAAFAIENLIKGNVIALHPEYISNGKLSRNVSNHKLSDLSAQIDGVSFDESEARLIRLLEELLPSWGRYPVPKQVSELAEEGILTSDIQATFQGLFDKLDSHLYGLIKFGWKGPHDASLVGLYRSDMEGMVPSHVPLVPEVIRKWKAEQADGCKRGPVDAPQSDSV